MILGEYISDGRIGSVHFDSECLVWVRMVEEGCIGEMSFEVFGGLDGCQGPDKPKAPFLQRGCQWCCDSTETSDKTSVEVGKSYETLQLL